MVLEDDNACGDSACRTDGGVVLHSQSDASAFNGEYFVCEFLVQSEPQEVLTVSSIGAVLYTAYLQSLSSLHVPSSHQAKRTYPPPSFQTTFTAGFIAGGIQSLLAAPFDALQVRFRTSDILEGKYKTMWHYAGHKLQSIGIRGIFGGFALSFPRPFFLVVTIWKSSGVMTNRVAGNS